MVMELKMVNPHFEAYIYTDRKGVNRYILCFDGWEGIGNIDEDGNKFYYHVDCDELVWNCADVYANGYSWFFSKVYEEHDTNADFSNTEIEIIIHTMLEAIKNGGIE